MADSDVINGFLGNLGFGFKSVVDKVKETATKVSEGAKELSPQYQAAKTAMSQFKGSDTRTVQTTTPSGRIVSRRVPISTASSKAIPTTKSTYKKGMGIGTMLNRVSEKLFKRKTLFGMPTIVVVGGGTLVGLMSLRRLRRK